MIQTQLCTFKTADKERLHGVLFTPVRDRCDLGLLFVHGVAMNFYLPPLVVFGQELAKRGHHSLVINTRGHDWISRSGNLKQFGGSTYELIDDCLFDLDAALDWLGRQGYRRFVLIGHSLGAIKSIIYQSRRRRAAVVGIVACSAPNPLYADRVARQPEFPALAARAEVMAAEGKADEVLAVNFGGSPGLFTARTLLDKYCRDDRNDLRSHAARVGCPLLAIVGGAEAPFFHLYADEIVRAAGRNGKYECVEGANHFYNRHTSEMVGLIDAWLRQFQN